MTRKKLFTIARYSQSVDAYLAKTRLDAAGIECFILDENLISMNWLYSNALGGVKLQVELSDAEEAKKILEEE